MIKLSDLLLETLLEKKLCPKGRAYYNRRIAAGEKPSAYLSGRAVKVCKGLMEEDDLNEDQYGDTSNFDLVKQNPFDIKKLADKGIIFITKPGDGKGGVEEPNWEGDASIITLKNLSNAESWMREAVKNLLPKAIPYIQKNQNKLLHNGKYNQILWGIEKKGLKPEDFYLSLNENINPSEAYSNIDSVQTIIDGKRNVAFVVEKGDTPQNWKRVTQMVANNGLKSVYVKGNPHHAYVVYTPEAEKTAMELKAMAEKYGGYLASNATAEDTRRIGQLLDYDPEQIEQFIKDRYIDELKIVAQTIHHSPVSNTPLSWTKQFVTKYSAAPKKLDLKVGKYNLSGEEYGSYWDWDKGNQFLSPVTRRNAENLFRRLNIQPEKVYIGMVAFNDSAPESEKYWRKYDIPLRTSFYITGTYNNNPIAIARKETTSSMAGQTYLVTPNVKKQLSKLGTDEFPINSLEESLHEDLENTSWTGAKGQKITLKQLLDAIKNYPVKNVPIEKVEKIVIKKDSGGIESNRLGAADTKYPIIIVVDDSENFKYILDGNHRANKAIDAGLKSIPAKLVNIKKLPQEFQDVLSESLRDWFKKEDWVRIDTQGNITGPCGTMKKGKATTRCLPRAKANRLTKAERAATARKKVAGSKKGKQFVPNTEKAKVRFKK